VGDVKTDGDVVDGLRQRQKGPILISEMLSRFPVNAQFQKSEFPVADGARRQLAVHPGYGTRVQLEKNL
jgi:hypothetical protein